MEFHASNIDAPMVENASVPDKRRIPR
jgi:hypothetical protein